MYPSLEAARIEFDRYARIEPRLAPLWQLCRAAAAPVREDDDDADDPAALPDDGWCAEDYFHDAVKSKLLLLVGGYLSAGPAELQSSTAYDTVYDLLINWALHRPCACCAGDDEPAWSEDDGRPAYG